MDAMTFESIINKYDVDHGTMFCETNTEEHFNIDSMFDVIDTNQEVSNYYDKECVDYIINASWFNQMTEAEIQYVNSMVIY